MHIARRHIGLGLGLSLTLAVMAAVPAAAGTTLIVRPGQSIQAALNAAVPGDTVYVEPGVYHENLEITSNDITLIGNHAVLEPPATPASRRCSTALGLTQDPFGLCVTGTLQNGLPPTVLQPVENVTIEGMTIGQFPSTGIVTLGADHVTIENSSATGGSQYGILLSQTSHATTVSDFVTGGAEAGIYVGDSPGSHDVVARNNVTDSGVFGIFVRDASDGVVAENRVTDNCVGIGLTPDQPGQDTVSNWLISRNEVDRNGENCPSPSYGGPPFSGLGILLAGTENVVTTGNIVDDNAPAPGVTPLWDGGIALVPGAPFGGPADPQNTVIAGNSMHGNQADDLNIVDAGTGGVFVGNHCQTSSPSGLCSPLTGHRR